jgi:hypothetical protein
MFSNGVGEKEGNLLEKAKPSNIFGIFSKKIQFFFKKIMITVKRTKNHVEQPP